MDNRDLLVEEAAKLVGCAPSTLRAWCRHGLKHSRNYKNWRVFQESDVLAFAREIGFLDNNGSAKMA